MLIFYEVINLKIQSTTVGAVQDNAHLPLSKLNEKCIGENHSSSPCHENFKHCQGSFIFHFSSTFSAPKEPYDFDSVQSKLAFFFFDVLDHILIFFIFNTFKKNNNMHFYPGLAEIASCHY